MAMARMISLLLILLLVAAIPHPATATNWVVGDAEGWGVGVNYDLWASGKNFAVNDTLGDPFNPCSIRSFIIINSA